MSIRQLDIKSGSPLFCDLYHLTMAQAWYKDGKADEYKVSEAFFRKCPFGGSYLVTAGLGEFLEWIKNWHFSDDDIRYLRTVQNADGTLMFTQEFLDFVKDKKLKINIQAIPEGELVFPNEPVYSVSGPCWQVELVEAALLNIFNSQSLVATKASRMVHAAALDGKKRPLLEFGLRRAQEKGGFSQTRASYIGGSCGTSNVMAAKYYGIKASGTMAHSFVMSYENEIDAFKSFLKGAQGNTTLLVDTYNTYEGVKNAIKASQETGINLMGIRIDSGDLAYWGREAKKLLLAAGFTQTKLVASNDLDEHLIENLVMVQQAPYDIFAAGTKLVTAYDTPALGGVFKTKQYLNMPKIKIAEGKTTIPSATNVMRIIRDGAFNGDIILKQDDSSIISEERLNRDVTSYTLNSQNGKYVRFSKGDRAYLLLKPVVVEGRLIEEPETNLDILQQNTLSHLAMLDEAYKRLSNPHIYGVGLEENLFFLQQNLIRQHQAQELNR